MNPLALPPERRHHSFDALHPQVRGQFRKLSKFIEQLTGQKPYVSSAVRTFAEQRSGDPNLRVPCSWHQFGRAADLDFPRHAWEHARQWWAHRGGWSRAYPELGVVHFQLAEKGVPPAELCGTRSRADFEAYWRLVGGSSHASAGPLVVGAIALGAAWIWSRR